MPAARSGMPYLKQLRSAVYHLPRSGRRSSDWSYSKATGIQFLADRFGLSLDDCYVIGDSMNDLPMLDYVQHSILMGNGTPSLRSHVEYVTTDILDDGIENALVHYNLIP